MNEALTKISTKTGNFITPRLNLSVVRRHFITKIQSASRFILEASETFVGKRVEIK